MKGIPQHPVWFRLSAWDFLLEFSWNGGTPDHPKLDRVNIDTYWNPWFWEFISRNPIRNTIFDYWRAPVQSHFCKKISNLCWLFTCEMTCVLFDHKSLGLLQSHVCCGQRESPHCQEVNTTFNDVKGCDEVKDRNGGQTAPNTPILVGYSSVIKQSEIQCD